MSRATGASKGGRLLCLSWWQVEVHTRRDATSAASSAATPMVVGYWRLYECLTIVSYCRRLFTKERKITHNIDKHVQYHRYSNNNPCITTLNFALCLWPFFRHSNERWSVDGLIHACTWFIGWFWFAHLLQIYARLWTPSQSGLVMKESDYYSVSISSNPISRSISIKCVLPLLGCHCCGCNSASSFLLRCIMSHWRRTSHSRVGK